MTDAEQIDCLERQLSLLAMSWRRCAEDPVKRAAYHQAYCATLEELLQLDSWSGEPDADSQLPETLMPEAYRAYWRKRLDR